MHPNKHLFLFVLLLCCCTCHATDVLGEFFVYFKPGSSEFDPSLADNARKIDEIKNLLDRNNDRDSIRILDISFCGFSSPEGSYELNERLSNERRAVLENIVKSHPSYPAGLQPGSARDSEKSGIAWDALRRWVDEGNMPWKGEVIAIIDRGQELVPYGARTTIDTRVQKLKKLRRGAPWRYIHDNYFDKMRSGVAIVVHGYKEAPKPLVVEMDEFVIKPDAPATEAQTETEQTETIAQVAPREETDSWTRHIYLKTNAVGWAMSNANIAGEIDICKHLSFTLPIYYSGVNYFTYKIKFRSLSIQPELRYWLRAENDGFFAAAHFGLSYFDFAFNGEYRYQDHNRNSPAPGAGVAVGYRLPISRNHRWKMEFSVGAGAYKVYYDKFENIPNGQRVGIDKKTYFGLDQISVAFAYTFNLRKGDRK